MKTQVLFFVMLLLVVLPAAGQVSDVPPVFAHPDSVMARRYPGQKAFYFFLFQARANRIRSCSGEVAYLKFRYNEKMQLDTLLTEGSMNDTLISPFRQRIRESVAYLKSPRMLNGKPAKSKWHIMPFFSDYPYGKNCTPVAKETNLLYFMLLYLFSNTPFSISDLAIEHKESVLLLPTKFTFTQ